MTLRILAVLLFAGICSANAPAEDLTVGDSAPAIDVKEFVKGDPVKEFEKGKIYVVEFWATWCPPCRATIPHLTKLQKKYKDITFIGVSVSERNPEKVKPFVKEMGDKMEYRVAMDLVPEGKGPNEGKMSKNWMEAAGQGGIPTAFIVEGAGKIAWIGHPMAMEKTLEKIASGKFDLQAAVVSFKKAKLREGTIVKLMAEVQKAKASGDSKSALEKIDAAIKDDEEIEESLAMPKFQLLRGKDGDLDKAIAYGKTLVSGTFKENAEALNYIAWTLCGLEEKKVDPKLAAFALLTAKKADEVSEGKNANIIDTLARAYFATGDLDKAIEAQERAVKLADMDAQKKELKAHLEEYLEAKKKKG